MNKLWVYCICWLTIAAMVFGVSAPALISAKSSLAVIAGIALCGGGVYALTVLGKIIYRELNLGEG